MIPTLGIIAITTAMQCRAWRYELPLSVSVKREAYVRVRLPAQVDPGQDGGYEDLRIIDRARSEVPYVLDPHHVTPATNRNLAMSDVGFVPGAFTEATLDAGDTGESHDAIRLQTDEPIFFAPVELASSDDRRTWRVLLRDALIYRVDNQQPDDTVVRFPSSRARWLRVRVLEPRHPFNLQSAFFVAAPPEESIAVVPAQIQPRRAATDDVREEAWIFNTGEGRIGATGISFTANQSTFDRLVRIDASNDGEHWYSVTEGSITRFATGEPSLHIPFPETYAEQFRIVVNNGDDAPVSGLRPELFRREHYVVFEAKPGNRYRILWGNDHADLPHYDLAERLLHENWSSTDFGDAAIPTEPAQRTFSKTSLSSGPVAFSLALLGCCLVLGILTLRSLRA